MMHPQIRLLTAILFFAIVLSPVKAQEEIGGDSGPAGSWTMISIHRTWTPQQRDYPNGGFGFQSFFDIDKPRRWWLGFALRGNGVERRDVLGLMLGPGVFFAGDSKLGAFAYLQTGLGIGTARGISGFDFFSDPTLTFGLASTLGVGGNIEFNRWLRLHLAVTSSWYTNERGQTPYGLQFGFTFGGR